MDCAYCRHRHLSDTMHKTAPGVYAYAVCGRAFQVRKEVNAYLRQNGYAWRREGANWTLIGPDGQPTNVHQAYQTIQATQER